MTEGDRDRQREIKKGAQTERHRQTNIILIDRPMYGEKREAERQRDGETQIQRETERQ
jgi:hypothetical protein